MLEPEAVNIVVAAFVGGVVGGVIGALLTRAGIALDDLVWRIRTRK